MLLVIRPGSDGKVSHQYAVDDEGSVIDATSQYWSPPVSVGWSVETKDVGAIVVLKGTGVADKGRASVRLIVESAGPGESLESEYSVRLKLFTPVPKAAMREPPVNR
jgi:hypothetical protein